MRRITEGQDRFIALTSHELRTPLTSLELQAESLVRLVASSDIARAPDARVRAKCMTILRQVGRLAAMTELLLETSRMSVAGVDLVRERLDLAQLVREVVTESEEVLRRSGSEIRCRSAGEVIGSWDRGSLRTVVRQLLSNASKFGRGRPIDVEVSKSRGCAVVIVRDQGIGIAKENLGRIFERYERAVSERHYGGLGVGLWIASEVAAAHGGALHVRSVEGAGSEFTVELPLEAAYRRPPSPLNAPRSFPTSGWLAAGPVSAGRRIAGHGPTRFGRRVDLGPAGEVRRPAATITMVAGLLASVASVLRPLRRRAWTAVASIAALSSGAGRRAPALVAFLERNRVRWPRQEGWR
jgi:hypothetical protein